MMTFKELDTIIKNHEHPPLSGKTPIARVYNVLYHAYKADKARYEEFMANYGSKPINILV